MPTSEPIQQGRPCIPVNTLIGALCVRERETEREREKERERKRDRETERQREKERERERPDRRYSRSHNRLPQRMCQSLLNACPTNQITTTAHTVMFRL